MNVLSLDSSSDLLAVALSNDGSTYLFEMDAGMRHSERMMELVDAILKAARLEPSDLNLVSCMRGPGSFTGLRIAMAAAKGLSVALSIPLISIGTLDCQAHAWRSFEGIVVPLNDARKGRFYTALYRRGTRIGEYLDATPEELSDAIAATATTGERIFLTGPDAASLAPRLSPLLPGRGLELDGICRRSYAKELLELAVIDYNEDKIGEDPGCGLLYLRKSSAELEFGAPGSA